MSHLRALLFCVLIGCLAACAAPPATTDAAARAEMTTALEASAASWNRGDLKGHLAIYD